MKIKSAILLFCVLLFAGTFSVTAQDFKEVDKTFKIDKDGRVTVDTYKGEIKIETWDKAEVHVYARMVPDDGGGFWNTSPEKQLDHVDVDIDASSSSVRIKSDYRKSNSWFGNNTRAFVYYKIQMPKTARLDVKDYKSESKVSGLQAPIKFETYKGEVTISDLTGWIDLETYKGEVDVRFVKLTDDCRFETYKGEINVSLPKSTGFSIDTDFGRRTDFYSSFDIDKRSYKHKRRDYSIREDVNGGGPQLRFSSTKGRIELVER